MSEPHPMSESTARQLLGEAAETIDVGPTGPLPTTRTARPSRRWLPAAAAAAAVLVVAAAVSVVGGGDGPDGPAPVVQSTSERQEQVRAGTWPLPGVAGLDETQAKHLLEARGYRVRVKRAGWIGCGLGTGDAVDTEPPTGAVVDPGSLVALRVAGAIDNGDGTVSSGIADCFTDHQELPYRLLAFARGVGPAPALADTVVIDTPSGRTTLGAAEAAGAGAWQVCAEGVCRRPLDALVALADLHADPYEPPDRSVTTGVTDRERGWSSRCSRRLARSEPPFVLGLPHEDIYRVPSCGVLDVYLDQAGRIAAVELAGAGALSRSDVSDVRGTAPTVATEAFRLAGLEAAVEEAECAGGLVTGQSTRGGTTVLTACRPD